MVRDTRGCRRRARGGARAAGGIAGGHGGADRQHRAPSRRREGDRRALRRRHARRPRDPRKGLRRPGSYDQRHRDDAHDVRHRLGDEAVHVLAAPDAGRRAPPVAERPRREIQSAPHAGEGHHAPRPRRTPLGISRLLSAGFRRPGDAEAAAGGRDHRRVRDASARFRAALAVLVQQHGVPHPRPRDRAGEPRALRQVPRRTDPGAAQTQPHGVRAGGRSGHGQGVHVVRTGRADSGRPGSGWMGGRSWSDLVDADRPSHVGPGADRPQADITGLI